MAVPTFLNAPFRALKITITDVADIITNLRSELLALADPWHASLTPAADWLLHKEIRRKGDWSIKRPDTEPSGWAFEFANDNIRVNCVAPGVIRTDFHAAMPPAWMASKPIASTKWFSSSAAR